MTHHNEFAELLAATGPALDRAVEERLAKAMAMAHAIDSDPEALIALDAEIEAFDQITSDHHLSDEVARDVDVQPTPRTPTSDPGGIGRWLRHRARRDADHGVPVLRLHNLRTQSAAESRRAPSDRATQIRPRRPSSFPQLIGVLMVLAAATMSILGSTAPSVVVVVFALTPAALVLNAPLERLGITTLLTRVARDTRLEPRERAGMVRFLHRIRDPEADDLDAVARAEIAIAAVSVPGVTKANISSDPAGGLHIDVERNTTKTVVRPKPSTATAGVPEDRWDTGDF